MNNNNNNNSDNGKEELGLSTELEDPKVIEQQLIQNGFLDPLDGVKESQAVRDPVYAILYCPEKVVSFTEEEDGSTVETTIIDHLLSEAHKQFINAYGDYYTKLLRIIPETMENLMASKDTLAKQITLLCMIKLDEGMQVLLQDMYPQDGHEKKRFPEFMEIIKSEMVEMMNTAYVNIPLPHIYNVDVLSKKFILSFCNRYPA